MDSFLDSFELLDQGPGPAGPGSPRDHRRRPPAVRRARPPHPATGPDPPAAPADRAGAAGLLQHPRAGLRDHRGRCRRGWAATPGDAESRASAARRRRPPRPGAPRSARSNGSMPTRTSWAATAMPPGPDGTKDQHFRLRLDLPPNTIIESLAISERADATAGSRSPATSGGRSPSTRTGGRSPGRTSPRSASSPGRRPSTCTSTPAPSPRRAAPIELEVVLSIDGRRVHPVLADASGPSSRSAPLADARGRAQARPAIPPAPRTGPAADARATSPSRRRGRTASPSGRESTEVPALLKPSSGGATIVSFDWLDRDDDHVGTRAGRSAPAAARTSIPARHRPAGRGDHRGDHHHRRRRAAGRPSPAPRSWPVAVVANQRTQEPRPDAPPRRVLGPMDVRPLRRVARKPSAPTRSSASRSSCSSAGPGIT